MKRLTSILFCFTIIVGCSIYKSNNTIRMNSQQQALAKNDTVKISNDELKFQIIIIEPGFNFWLLSEARPEGFYSQEYLESRNDQYVLEWNQRAAQPQDFSQDLYEMQINYKTNINYGYEVNYKLYNYFIYFQLKYNQRLGPFKPRI